MGKKQGKFHKFLALSASEQGLLIRIAFLLLVVSISLFFFPFRIVIKRIESVQLRVRRIDPASDCVSDRIGWAVRVASQYMPFAKCLTQALVTKFMLAQQGCPGQLRIGVFKRDNGTLEAHAWVESEGRIVIGELSNICRYRPMPPITGNGSWM